MKNCKQKFNGIFSPKKIVVCFYVILLVVFVFVSLQIAIVLKKNVYDIMENQELLASQKMIGENLLDNVSIVKFQSLIEQIEKANTAIEAKKSIYEMKYFKNVFD